jgi:tRNA(His) guanylyltransferase
MGKAPDPRGDRCKEFEMAEAGRKALPGLPLLARLDGRAFHTFTSGLGRPYDSGMSTAMIETTKALVDEFHPRVGYTQSDEITLAWYVPSESSSQYPFGGRYQKMTSILAGFASGYFNKLLPKYLPTKADLVPQFDCRVWQVPTLADAVEVFLWREADAVKNSITMAASAYYSHKQLMGVSSSQKHELLHAKGVNWNDYPAFFKRGSYVQRKTAEVTLTPEEVAAIPEKHRPPGNRAVRSRVEVLEIEPLARIPVPETVLFPIEAYSG